MNMASKCILLIFSVISISIGNAETGAFMSLKCKAENLGQYGQQSLLECVIIAKDDTEIRTVTWKKDDEGDDALLVFNKGNLKVQPGYSFAQPSWTVKDMNVSLLIDNTIVGHEGDYKCMVMTDRGNNEQTSSLKVTAKYSKPTIVSNPEAKILNTGGTLTCKSDGGYPKGELRWIDGRNAELTNEAQMEVKETDGGLFQLSSKLVLEKGSSVSNYTCSVFNASGDKEGEKLFEVKDAPRAEELEHRKTLDTATKIVAPVLVVGSLIVGLLIVGLLMIYKRRSRSGHIRVDPSALQEENIAMWRDSGENVTLRCFTAGCSRGIEGYDGMYLYHQTDHTKEKQVLYYHAEPGLIEQMNAEDGFKYRIQKEGSLKNHTFTISQLTVDDSGFYICLFVKFPSVEARCSAYTLFVKGVAQCSRSSTCALAEELVLIIIAACTIGTLVTIILMLLIVPRARRRIRSRTRTASVPNDNVYEDMNKNGLRPPPEG